MECEIAISHISNILRELIIKINELIEYNSEQSNNIESEHVDCYNASRNFIKMLERMNYVVEMQMRISPKMERERASNLASALVNGEKARVEAEILLNLLKAQRIKHEDCVNEMKAQIAEEILQLEQIENNHERGIAERIDESRNIMKKIIDEMAEKEEKLKIEIDLKNSELENICEKNIKNERVLYTMRKKAENEYLEILAMYDENVGELYRRMESLTDHFNLLDTNLKICEEKLITQETEYKMLKAEKELEILTIFNDNLNKFRRSRAAKIIQNAWRKYLERLLLRKKKKSKKKK